MTSNHPLRCVLARVCSAETMSRIVDPIFADMRWEDGTITLRGCIALVKALSLHAVMSLPRWCAAVWSDDDHAIPRAAVYVVSGAILVAALLLVYPTLQVRFEPKWSFFFTTIPQALATALPMTVLVAIPMTFRHRYLGARLLRRTLALLLILVGAMYSVVSRPTHEAHESLRGVEIYFEDGRHVTLRREPNETVWAALRRQVRDLERMKDARSEAAMVEYQYQGRWARATATVPFGLAGLAICVLQCGRRRPRLTGAAALILFVILFGTLSRVANRSVMPGLIADGSIYGVAICVWTTPVAMALIAASTILLSSRYLRSGGVQSH